MKEYEHGYYYEEGDSVSVSALNILLPRKKVVIDGATLVHDGFLTLDVENLFVRPGLFHEGHSAANSVAIALSAIWDILYTKNTNAQHIVQSFLESQLGQKYTNAKEAYFSEHGFRFTKSLVKHLKEQPRWNCCDLGKERCGEISCILRRTCSDYDLEKELTVSPAKTRFTRNVKASLINKVLREYPNNIVICELATVTCDVAIRPTRNLFMSKCHYTGEFSQISSLAIEWGRVEEIIAEIDELRFHLLGQSYQEDSGVFDSCIQAMQMHTIQYEHFNKESCVPRVEAWLRQKDNRCFADESFNNCTAFCVERHLCPNARVEFCPSDFTEVWVPESWTELTNRSFANQVMGNPAPSELMSEADIRRDIEEHMVNQALKHLKTSLKADSESKRSELSMDYDYEAVNATKARGFPVWEGVPKQEFKFECITRLWNDEQRRTKGDILGSSQAQRKAQTSLDALEQVEKEFLEIKQKLEREKEKHMPAQVNPAALRDWLRKPLG